MSQRKSLENKRLEKIQKMKDELEGGSLIALSAPEKLSTRCLHSYDSLSADRKRVLRRQIEKVLRDSMEKLFPKNDKNALSPEKEKEFLAHLVHFNFGIQPEDIKAAQGKSGSDVANDVIQVLIRSLKATYEIKDYKTRSSANIQILSVLKAGGLSKSAILNKLLLGIQVDHIYLPYM
jgi:hypothetical protein